METSAAPATDSTKATRRTLGLVFLTVFMDFLGFSIIFPIYPKLLEHYFARESEGSLLHGVLEVARGIVGNNNEVAVAALFGGVLGALFSALQFVCAPVWGKLSDRIGRRPVLLFTLTGTALAYGLWVFAGAFWVVVASRILAGVMAGNISVAQAAAADATTGRDRSKAMALIGMGIAAGILCGPAIGAISLALSVKFGITGGSFAAGPFGLNVFSLTAGLAFLMASVNAIVAYRYFPETHSPENRSQVAPRGSVFQLGKLESADIRRATIVNLLFFASFAGMESTLTFVALDLFKYTPGQNAVMFTFIAVSMGLVQGGIVRRVGHKIGEKRMAVAGLVAGIMAFVAIALIPSAQAMAGVSESWRQPLFYVGLFLFATAAGLSQPSLSALVSLYSDERTQGFHAGVFRSGGALARAVGPLAAAIIYFKTGGHTGVFFAGAIATFIPLYLATRLRQPLHATKA